MTSVCVARAERLRMKGLPKETGGVLIGYFDVPRRCVYVVDALPPPRDSIEHETAFIRGYAGLQDELDRIEERTGGQVVYVGEWHSHPDGAGVDLSDDDEGAARDHRGRGRCGWLAGRCDDHWRERDALGSIRVRRRRR